MLLKEEWVSTAGYLESAINAILVAGDDLMNSRALQVSYQLILYPNKNWSTFIIICHPRTSMFGHYSI